MLGGIFRSLVNPATLFQIAAGPAGWASLAMRTIGSQLALNVIQQLGQRMGLPQPMIDVAQAAFAQSAGMPGIARQEMRQAVSAVADQFNLSPRQESQMFRESMDALMRVQDGIRRGGLGEEEGTQEGRGSFLVAIAKALGQAMDQKAAQMEKLAGEITAATSDSRAGFINGVDGNRQGNSGAVSAETTKISSKTALLQAYSQELSMLSNAATNVIKSIGEANVTNARKG